MNTGAFKKGQKGGPGRPKGLPNRVTANAREAIARFVDGNAERLQGWLDQIAQDQGPQAAFACFTTLLEYHVPKLGRTEHTGENGGPIQVARPTIDWAALSPEARDAAKLVLTEMQQARGPALIEGEVE